eukprot:scaffold116_cov334-Pavlova_lutheri.AAC.12
MCRVMQHSEEHAPLDSLPFASQGPQRPSVFPVFLGAGHVLGSVFPSTPQCNSRDTTSLVGEHARAVASAQGLIPIVIQAKNRVGWTLDSVDGTGSGRRW